VDHRRFGWKTRPPTAIDFASRFIEGARLDLNHTVNFGRPWLPESDCDHGLISLPYLDGPAVEILKEGEMIIRCLWLIPVTNEEVEYKKRLGIESLEARFEESSFDYAYPARVSVV
jgi:hypothetical protein